MFRQTSHSGKSRADIMKIYFMVLLVFVQNCHTAPITEDKDDERICQNEQIPNLITEDTIIYQMKKPVDPFIGRQSELRELQGAQSGDKTTVITGSRGIGKTELARKYAEEFIKEDKKSSTIWIDAENIESLSFSFKKLASYLGIEAEDKTASEIIQETFARFLNKRALFIFDNAESDNYVMNNLQKFVVGRPVDLHFLITTRDNKWNRNKFKVLNLDVFNKEDGEEFLKKNLEDISEEEAEKLAKLLRYLPLALSKAARYIKDKSGNYKINDFINEYSNLYKLEQVSPAEDLLREQQITQLNTPNLNSDIYRELNLRPTQTIYLTTVRSPTSEEIREVVADKVEKELGRFSDKVHREASRIGQQISQAGKNAERKVRKFFKRLRNDVSG